MSRMLRVLAEERAYAVVHGDCWDVTKHIPRQSLDIVVSSPPYNIGKSYESRKPLEAYLKPYESLARRLFRALKPEGSVCWQVGNYTHNGRLLPLDIPFYDVFTRAGFQLRNRVIWTYGHGLHASKRFSGRYETVMWFTKSDSYTFNLDSIRVPSKYPGKKHFKGPKKGQLSGNPLGKNPSDVWLQLAREWKQAVWDVPNVKHRHPEKEQHPCQFPVEIAERCILALTNPGGVVYDPFCGSGSTLLAALKNKRRALGCEREEAYVDLSKERISRWKRGELRFRPIERPIHQA